MCYNCCCNIQQKRCYQFGIIFTSLYIIVFEIVLAVFAENSIKPEELEDSILAERPLFDFEVTTDSYRTGKNNIIFFEYKGWKSTFGGKTTTYDKTNFTKIYENKFFYDGKDRNYFDYKNKYSVKSEENCPSNYQKCGILDSTGRILCLPNGENCPLNGFEITNTNSNPFDGISDIVTKEVSFFGDVTHYIHYTNKNTNGKIITQFKLSKGKPCAKASENSWVRYFNNEVDENYECITSIGGTTKSDRYDKVNSQGIDIINLYKDNGITTYPNSMTDLVGTTVDLYVRNYNEIDEKCVQEFLDDFKDEKKYYDSAFKTVRALSLIGLILALALFIFILTTCQCCCNLNYHGIAIVVPIYGIAANIVVVGITNKAKIKYECQSEGLNEGLDDVIDDQYGSATVNIVMSVLSIVAYSIVLMFTLCLKFMRNTGMVNPAIVPTPVPAVYPAAYPAPYQGAYPAPVYPAPYGQNVAYQNVVPASY